MDRFIDFFIQMSAFCTFDLKSNMDRFIGIPYIEPIQSV